VPHQHLFHIQGQSETLSGQKNRLTLLSLPIQAFIDHTFLYTVRCRIGM
jgi:hypothetical protein